tara:strand:- start:114812 stop:115966 length:1155 start_codon:yes stop_codon:yes gene_type:complete
MTGIAFVGCGFVSDYYVRTLEHHSNLELIGAYDHDPTRLQHWSEYHNVYSYQSYEKVLADDRVSVIVNLTNPHSHYQVSSAALSAGKHVYSEKPLATSIDDATALVKQARDAGLELSSAPCNLFSETAQTIWKALRDGLIGKSHLVYAELDDDLIHRAPYQNWKSESGVAWPAQDEFEVGCTMEHAGYYLAWLVAYFGQIDSVTSFGSICVADKAVDFELRRQSPDFTCACIRFESGMIARLTCSIIATHDHRLRIFGDEGVLSTQDCWFYRSPVHLQRRWEIRRRMMMSPFKKRLPLIGEPSPKFAYKGSQQLNFAQGIADLADAVNDGRPCYLDAEFCLHVNEAVIAISESLSEPGVYQMKTSCTPPIPLEEFRAQYQLAGV